MSKKVSKDKGQNKRYLQKREEGREVHVKRTSITYKNVNTRMGKYYTYSYTLLYKVYKL